jgi:acyl-CoA thioesterase
MTSRFASDTSVRQVEDEPTAWTADVDRGWWIERGPNGGYVAALIARAVAGAVDDPGRSLRSLTVHYLRPPGEGPVTLRTVVERQGRSMTTVSARMEQRDRVVALALAACSGARDTVSWADAPPPEVPAPEDIAPPPQGPTIPMGERYEMRWAIGSPPFGGGDEALSGGWIRLRPEEGSTLGDSAAVRSALLVALTDAWMPPVFSKVAVPMAVPTVDLTVHLRSPLPADHDDWFLVEFRSATSVDGFLEEDGRIWTRDGLLVAQSRQLAVVM